MKMKAAVLYGVKEPLVVETVELDPPKAGEVLVKMVATGICHTDIHRFTGDALVDYPVVLGHEGAGIVKEVGEGVTRVKSGDHVVLTFLPSCGQCRWCHNGQPTLCDLGALLRTGKMLDATTRLHRATDGSDINSFLFNSTFAEYTVVPDASLVPVASHLPLERICLFGCGFTTGFGTATRKLQIQPGETVTIIGCGGLGLAAIQGAVMSGLRLGAAVFRYRREGNVPTPGSVKNKRWTFGGGCPQACRKSSKCVSCSWGHFSLPSQATTTRPPPPPESAGTR